MTLPVGQRRSRRSKHRKPGIEGIVNPVDFAVFRTLKAIFQERSGLKRVARPTVRFANLAPRCTPEGDPMNTSIKTRATALVAAILVTFGTIELIADYAYPVAPAVQLASTAR
jgi:hypothetical protein